MIFPGLLFAELSKCAPFIAEIVSLIFQFSPLKFFESRPSLKDCPSTKKNIYNCITFLTLIFTSYFTEAFQHVRENFSELESVAVANDTDLVFLKGLLDNPAVSQLIQVSSF
jgi:hypothetical protein